MTYALYALLGEGAPAITTDSLASDLKNLFKDQKDFSIKFEQVPFAKSKSLALWWGTWLVRVAYEEGANVVADSTEISKVVGSEAPHGLADIGKRIRAVLSTDESREHTDQCIYVEQFLRGIPGVILYDSQQRRLIR
jgi:hypothetical protein